MAKPEPSHLSREQLEAAKGSVDDIIARVVNTSAKGDLGGFGSIFDAMEKLVSGLNLPIEGFADQLGNLRATTAAVNARAKDDFAAQWAGDLPRMRALQELPYPGTSHLVPETDPAGTADFDDCEWDDPALQDVPDTYGDLIAGKPGAVDRLLSQGVDLNQRSGVHELTAFQAALHMPGRNAATLSRLVAAGADPRLLAPFDSDPIFCAVGYEHTDSVTEQSERDVFKLLFEAGCNPNAKSREYAPPLLVAIQLGGRVEVAILLEAGARIDVKKPRCAWASDFDGYTPLMMAAPKPDVFRLLLEHGADPGRRGAGPFALEEFIAQEAQHASDRAQDDWTRHHAGALHQSLHILRRHAARA